MGNSRGVLCPSPRLPQWQHLAKPLDAPVTRTLTQRPPPNSGAWKGTHCVWLSVTQPCHTAWPFTSGTLPSRCSPSVTEESGFSDCVKPLLRLTSRSLGPSWGGTPDLARGPRGHPMAQPTLSQGAMVGPPTPCTLDRPPDAAGAPAWPTPGAQWHRCGHRLWMEHPRQEFWASVPSLGVFMGRKPATASAPASVRTSDTGMGEAVSYGAEWRTCTPTSSLTGAWSHMGPPRAAQSPSGLAPFTFSETTNVCVIISTALFLASNLLCFFPSSPALAGPVPSSLFSSPSLVQKLLILSPSP